MADDVGEKVSILSMGSLYEAIQLGFFDLISIILKGKMQQSAEKGIHHLPTNPE